jgi:hypothetical protein
MADHVPLSEVRTGPRDVDWLPEKPATLTWAEALDGGNPKETVPHRDRILIDAAPFRSEHQQVGDQGTFSRAHPTRWDQALIVDYERRKRILTTQAVDLYPTPPLKRASFLPATSAIHITVPACRWRKPVGRSQRCAAIR